MKTKKDHIVGRLGRTMLAVAICAAMGLVAAGCGHGSISGSLESSEDGTSGQLEVSSVSFGHGRVDVYLSAAAEISASDILGAVCVSGPDGSVPMYRANLLDGGTHIALHGPLAYQTEYTVGLCEEASASQSKALPAFSETGNTGRNPKSIFAAGDRASPLFGWEAPNFDPGTPVYAAYALRGSEFFPPYEERLLTLSDVDGWVFEDDTYDVALAQWGPYGSFILGGEGRFALAMTTQPGIFPPIEAFMVIENATSMTTSYIVPSISEGAFLLGGKAMEDLSGDGLPEIGIMEVYGTLETPTKAYARIFYSERVLAGEVPASVADVSMEFSTNLLGFQYYALDEGDFNGDGLNDIVMIDDAGDPASWVARIRFGGSGFLEDDVVINAAAGIQRIWSVMAGDVNGDGIDDVAMIVANPDDMGGIVEASISAPSKVNMVDPGGGSSSSYGEILVFLGRESWEPTLSTSGEVADLAIGMEEAPYLYGLNEIPIIYGIALTDYDGDGIDDIWIGSPNGGIFDRGSMMMSGVVYLFYGDESIGTEGADRELTPSEEADLFLLPEFEGSIIPAFGMALYNYGDMNNDGIDDMAIASGDINSSAGFWIWPGGRDENGARLEDEVLNGEHASSVLAITVTH